MTALKPLTSKATSSLPGPSAPRLNPQSQKDDTECQWGWWDTKAWLGRTCLFFQHDSGIAQGENHLISDFSCDNDACEEYHHHHGSCRPLPVQISDLLLCLCPIPLPLQPTLPCPCRSSSQCLLFPTAILIQTELC